MRVLLLIASCLIITSSIVAATEGEDFKGEFFQGMETGFFLRDTPDGHREYDCPDVSLKSDILSTLN